MQAYDRSEWKKRTRVAIKNPPSGTQRRETQEQESNRTLYQAAAESTHLLSLPAHYIVPDFNPIFVSFRPFCLGKFLVFSLVFF